MFKLFPTSRKEKWIFILLLVVLFLASASIPFLPVSKGEMRFEGKARILLVYQGLFYSLMNGWWDVVGICLLVVSIHIILCLTVTDLVFFIYSKMKKKHNIT